MDIQAPGENFPVSGLLALLKEDVPEFWEYAISSLLDRIDEFWAEISTEILRIENIVENSNIDAKTREKASLLASKVFYHLGDVRTATTFALGAGDSFVPTHTSEYVSTIVSFCVGEYVGSGSAGTDERGMDGISVSTLSKIVEAMFERCWNDGFYKEALGLAFESRNFDLARATMLKCPSEDRMDLLSYCYSYIVPRIPIVSAKLKALKFVVGLFVDRTFCPDPDYYALCRLYVSLEDMDAVSLLLAELVSSENDMNVLTAYQIAFDLSEECSRKFLNNVSKRVKETGKGKQELDDILSGTLTSNLHLQFLFKNNRVDWLLLQKMKASVESLRTSIYSTAVVYAHSIMAAGTATDTFLRNNVEWILKLKNWNQFGAVASLGLIHREQEKSSSEILSPYLPFDGAAPGAAAPGTQKTPFKEAGAFYALGLIHAGRGLDNDIGRRMLEYLPTLSDETAEVILHGLCLGIGLAGMGTHDVEVVNLLKNSMMTDTALPGEASAIAIGLVMMGSGDMECAEELMQYAHRTKHETIIRGVALGIGFITYECGDSASELIESLISDSDPILRYGAAVALALAFFATASSYALRKLLNLAVTDADPAVRRMSVISLAFVLHGHSEELPGIVTVLSESYNPHVRYGAALAIGISCSGMGTGSSGIKSIDKTANAAWRIVEPLMKDSEDFVRQAAMMAAGMMCVSQNEERCPDLPKLRTSFLNSSSSRHEPLPPRIGSIFALGLMDAGGRNCTLRLEKSLSSAAGMMLFCQFWYWYPFVLGCGLSLRPACVICVDETLKVPKFSFVSKTPASRFAVAENLKPEKERERRRTTNAILSRTGTSVWDRMRRQQARGGVSKTVNAAEKEKEKEKGKGKEEEEEEKSSSNEQKQNAREKDSKIVEPVSILTNPARVLPSQVDLISFDKSMSSGSSFESQITGRWRPLRLQTSLGISVVVDSCKGDPVSYLKDSLEEEEPEPPEAFEYDSDAEK